MRRAAFRQRTSILTSARIRIRSELRGLGIEMDEQYWVWPTQSGYTDQRGIDWVSFLQPLSEFVQDNPDLGNCLRWLMACWLTGCGGEFLPVLPVTAHNRIRAVRKFLLALFAKHRYFEAITPRQAAGGAARTLLQRGGSLHSKGADPSAHVALGTRTISTARVLAHGIFS
jgi:hypothetical protein